MDSYIPKEHLFHKFMKSVINTLYRLPEGWKEIKEAEDCVLHVPPRGPTIINKVQRKWTDEANKHSSFPVCIVKRQGDRSEGLEVFYVISGHAINKYKYELFIKLFRFENQRFTEINQFVYQQNGRRTYGKDTQPEFTEMNSLFQQVFSEDPKYRLWAVTGNLFKARES